MFTVDILKRMNDRDISILCRTNKAAAAYCRNYRTSLKEAIFEYRNNINVLRKFILTKGIAVRIHYKDYDDDDDDEVVTAKIYLKRDSYGEIRLYKEEIIDEYVSPSTRPPHIPQTASSTYKVKPIVKTKINSQLRRLLGKNVVLINVYPMTMYGQDTKKRSLKVGPRGGRYYIGKRGKKVYVKK